MTSLQNHFIIIIVLIVLMTFTFLHLSSSLQAATMTSFVMDLVSRLEKKMDILRKMMTI